APTTTALTAPASSKVGQTVTLSAKVVPTAGLVSQLAGQPITFKDGGIVIGTAPMDSSGVATLSLATLEVGPHSLTAVYGGDVHFSPSTSAAKSLPVAKNTTTAALTLSPTASNFGRTVTLTAKITPAA